MCSLSTVIANQNAPIASGNSTTVASTMATTWLRPGADVQVSNHESTISSVPVAVEVSAALMS